MSLCRQYSSSSRLYIALFPPIVEDTHMKYNTESKTKQKEKLYYIRYLNTMCVLPVQGCRLNTDSLVQCGYEVRFTNVKAYVLMEATGCTATINGS